MNALVFAVALALGGSAGPSADEARSVYTEISAQDCTVLSASGEPGDDEDGLNCPGPAGYTLQALSGDLRASITVVTPDGVEQPLEFWTVITGSFSHLGPRAEWRMREIDGKLVPHALVVRVFAQEDPANPERETSWLAVAKIGAKGSCVTDRIEAGVDDNLRARTAADNATARPCLGSLQP